MLYSETPGRVRARGQVTARVRARVREKVEGACKLKRLDWYANALITGNEKYVVTDSRPAEGFLWGHFERAEVSLFFCPFFPCYLRVN